MLKHVPCVLLLILAFFRATSTAAPDDALHSEPTFHATLDHASDLIDGRYRPLTYSEAQWYGSAFFTGPDWTRVGRDWHHPGQNTPSVRCFVAPRDGQVVVAGRVFKLHLAGDGVRAVIRHNDHEIWRTEIAGDDAEGREHQLELRVQRGDCIRFLVHKRVAISCDTTGWDPTIRYVDDDHSYAASQAFDQHRQGADGWRYEMEVSDSDRAEWPVLQTWTHDGFLDQRPVRLGTPVEITHRDALPAFVIADGRDQAGLAVAAESGSPWRFTVRLDAQGQVQISFFSESKSVPVWSSHYDGAAGEGWKQCDRQLSIDDRYGKLKTHWRQSSDASVSMALTAMVQQDWQRQDAIDGTTEQFRSAADKQSQLASAMLTGLQEKFGRPPFREQAERLDAMAADDDQRGMEPDAARARWLAVRQLKRRIALSNPLLDFGPLLVCQRVPPSWSHEVAQYFGWRQRPGGGLYVVLEPGRSLETRDILGGQLPPGSVLEPRLSYDGRRILFAFVACDEETPEPASLAVNESGRADRYFHLYEINVDGSGLRQLTDGPYDDMMADYLPDGDIVFCSTRRRGYSRCFGPEYSYRWHTYTLHRMEADGSEIRTLSYNDVSEWFPAVSNSGHVLHARWDYIDRDAVTHQNLWSIRPDGSNAAAVWGNAVPKPHCVFQAKPIPNSNKIVFIASAHHAITAGPVCIVDPSVGRNTLDAVTRITPQPFPEAEGKPDEWYSAPWPLSEDYFLVAYSPFRLRFQGEHMHDPNPDNGLGVYLLDSGGNRELLYRDPAISTTNPMPLASRPRPPLCSEPQRAAHENPDTGTVFLQDVYRGLPHVARGTIKELRIVQIFPKSTWLANQPRMGVAGEENGRAILGTVPIEADGSAHFQVPALKPLLLQALDEKGMAFQTMRSLMFVQPGERISCVGCHEHPMSSPPASVQIPLALRRDSSVPDPGELGGRPFGFAEMVQPVLDRHCIRCHGDETKEAELNLTGVPDSGFSRAYVSLCGLPGSWTSQSFDPTLSETHLVPRFVQRNQIQQTPPGGVYGARGSRLLRLLLEGHEGVKLTDSEIRRLAAWIDMNAIFYGVYDAVGQQQQLRGRPVPMPEIQ